MPLRDRSPHPDNGCNYVLNPATGQLEDIWVEEYADREGEDVHSVETRSGTYEVDGSAIFVKMTETYRKIWG